VSVPFPDRSGVKRRPALVVSTRRFHAKLPGVIVCPISSQPRYYERPGPGDRPIQGWSAVGLRRPSTVRISNIVAIDKRILARTLGRLNTRDMEGVEAGLREALGV
jgi:mRNA-degrading endonuclease toxin of MazEF toxin-antitoxin module